MIYTLRGEMEKKSIKGGNSLCRMTSYNRKLLVPTKRWYKLAKIVTEKKET